MDADVGHRSSPPERTEYVALAGGEGRAAPSAEGLHPTLPVPPSERVARVYCGNYTTWRGMFEEPDECSYEGDVPLTECPEDDFAAAWVCPGCGVLNTVSDHEVTS